MGSKVGLRMSEAEVMSTKGPGTDTRIAAEAGADILVVVEAGEVIWMFVAAGPFFRKLAEGGAEDTRRLGNLEK